MHHAWHCMHICNHEETHIGFVIIEFQHKSVLLWVIKETIISSQSSFLPSISPSATDGCGGEEARANCITFKSAFAEGGAAWSCEFLLRMY